MRHYFGDRTIDGIVVTVDDQPLDQRLDLQKISSNGFEWTYLGPEPQQLALALLANHFGTDDSRALRLSDAFMRSVIAHLDNSWALTSAEIDAAVEAIDREGAN